MELLLKDVIMMMMMVVVIMMMIHVKLQILYETKPSHGRRYKRLKLHYTYLIYFETEQIQLNSVKTS
jgi:hypothetical protein